MKKRKIITHTFISQGVHYLEEDRRQLTKEVLELRKQNEDLTKRMNELQSNNAQVHYRNTNPTPQCSVVFLFVVFVSLFLCCVLHRYIYIYF